MTRLTLQKGRTNEGINSSLSVSADDLRRSCRLHLQSAQNDAATVLREGQDTLHQPGKTVSQARPRGYSRPDGSDEDGVRRREREGARGTESERSSRGTA